MLRIQTFRNDFLSEGDWTCGCLFQTRLDGESKQQLHQGINPCQAFMIFQYKPQQEKQKLSPNMGVVMFDGYAGPGWVWPIGCKSYYWACTKVLCCKTGIRYTIGNVASPPMGGDFKASSLGADSLLIVSPRKCFQNIFTAYSGHSSSLCYGDCTAWNNKAY